MCLAVRSQLWEVSQNDGCNQDDDRTRYEGILYTLKNDLEMSYDIDLDGTIVE